MKRTSKIVWLGIVVMCLLSWVAIISVIYVIINILINVK